MRHYERIQELCIRAVHAALSDDRDMCEEIFYHLYMETGIEDEREILRFIDNVMKQQVCSN